MGGGGLPPRGRFGAGLKPEDGGDGGIGVGRGDFIASKAIWEPDCSDISTERGAAESGGGGSAIAC